MINTDNIQIGELAGYSFDCGCGRKHNVDIQKIIIEEQVYNRLPEVIKDCMNKKIFIVADTHTYRIYGEKVYNTLESGGIKSRRMSCVPY